MTDEQIKQCTIQIKAMADVRKLAIEDTDIIINRFFENLNSQHEKPLLENLSVEEKDKFAEKRMELRKEEEARVLEAKVEQQVNGGDGYANGHNGMS